MAPRSNLNVNFSKEQLAFIYLPSLTGSIDSGREKRGEIKQLVILERCDRVFAKLIKSFYVCLFKYFKYVISDIYCFVFLESEKVYEFFWMQIFMNP